MDRQMDGWIDGQMENLPILLDFVPYWGRCPKRKRVVVNVLILGPQGVPWGHQWVIFSD